MFLVIVVVALADYKKASGSKVKDANHAKPNPPVHGGNSAARGAKHAPKPAAVASAGGAEPEIDDRYDNIMSINWNIFEENKDKIN